MELDSSNARNNVFSWVIFVIYLLLNVLIFAITYAKYYQGEKNKFKKKYFKYIGGTTLDCKHLFRVKAH